MNYYNLPLLSVSHPVSYKTRKQHYQYLSGLLTNLGQSTLEYFHHGNFLISGTNHLLPEFIVSSNAKNNLIYPQGFCILEADKYYYTDRSGIDSFELRFTLDGSGYLEYNQKTYTLKKGEGFLINCNEKHYYKTLGDKWTATIFHFNGKLASNIYEQYSQDGNVKFTSLFCPNFEMLQLQILKATQRLVPYTEYKISCLFDILLSELLAAKAEASSPQKMQPDFMEELVEYIKENYSDSLSIKELIHMFGISHSHLHREFKKYTGFTPKNYILQIRINNAKTLLKESSLSIEQIAEKTGFNDTAHFIQMFKKHQQLTPLKYRKSFKNQLM